MRQGTGPENVSSFSSICRHSALVLFILLIFLLAPLTGTFLKVFLILGLVGTVGVDRAGGPRLAAGGGAGVGWALGSPAAWARIGAVWRACF